MDGTVYSIIPINSLIENKQLEDFTCGDADEEFKIDNFLKNESKTTDLKGLCKSFLYMKDKELVGFFSLCTSETKVTKKFKDTKLNNKTFKTEVPVNVYPSIELVYFAIKSTEQKKKLGTSMMYALLEMLYYNVYPYVGFIMVTLESRNVATEFYHKMGFAHHNTQSGNDRLMALTITDIEALLGMDEE